MNLEHRVQHLELQYESLDGTVQKILVFTKATHDILMAHIADTREEFKKVHKRLDGVERDVAVLKTDVDVLKTDVDVLKTDVAEL
ncbi:hypothetical protein, partial [Sansalvadorimonas verongulae]|uniref:hypothetical protein n=1 Tax=Sansalvadorimonas verongulae TaxID=2172824 RepID=UPI001E62BF1B